ncbi:hypothetical protein [Hirschia litorea]|uniref:Uncharacterized protein n=1 Tax=Hirschia litorea TaxID=1199156 RepID=A0ABW2IPP2_9PROT
MKLSLFSLLSLILTVSNASVHAEEVKAQSCRMALSYSGKDIGDHHIVNFGVEPSKMCGPAETPCEPVLTTHSFIYGELILAYSDRSITLGITLEILIEDAGYIKEGDPAISSVFSVDTANIGIGLRDHKFIRSTLNNQSDISIGFVKLDQNDTLVSSSFTRPFKIKRMALPTPVFSYSHLNKFVMQDTSIKQHTIATSAPFRTFIRFENSAGKYTDFGPIDSQIDALLNVHFDEHNAALTASSNGHCHS